MKRSRLIESMTAAIFGLVITSALMSGCATYRPGGTAVPSTASSTNAPPVLSPSPSDSVTSSLPSPSPSPSPSSSAAADASVVIITLDVIGANVEASGMVPGLVEEGGACTLTLTQASTERSVSGGAAGGRESTYCGLLTFPTDQLSVGSWTVVLEYRSADHHGISDTGSVTVP